MKVHLKNFFQRIVLRGYVTDGEGTRPCFECINGHLSQCNDSETNVEIADRRLVGHIGQPLITGITRIVVFSNETDVVMFFLYHMYRFFRQGARQIWLRYGIGKSKRYEELPPTSRSVEVHMQQYYYVVNLCDKFYIFKSLHWSLVIMDGKK